MKPFLLFLVLTPLLFNGCASSGGGWISANNPGYNSKPGPDGESLLNNVAPREDSQIQVASNKTIENAPSYHHYDDAPARAFVGSKQNFPRMNTQYVGGSSGSRNVKRSNRPAVSSGALQDVTQK